MKILFLISNPPIAAVSTWEELKKYKELGYVCPTKDNYFLIKALEKNIKFEQAILSARKHVGISETGITWQEYRDNFSTKRISDLPENNRKYVFDMISKVVLEVTKIMEVMDLELPVSEQLFRLVLGNFVYFEYPPIVWYSLYPTDTDGNKIKEEYNYNVRIDISTHITKNELITFIEDNWTEIDKSVLGLKPKTKFFISPRDQRIIELRDIDNLPFKKIADIIINEFKIDDLDGAINEDAVKTAYKRAKAKILSLTDKQKSNM